MNIFFQLKKKHENILINLYLMILIDLDLHIFFTYHCLFFVLLIKEMDIRKLSLFSLNYRVHVLYFNIDVLVVKEFQNIEKSIKKKAKHNNLYTSTLHTT